MTNVFQPDRYSRELGLNSENSEIIYSSDEEDERDNRRSPSLVPDSFENSPPPTHPTISPRSLAPSQKIPVASLSMGEKSIERLTGSSSTRARSTISRNADGFFITTQRPHKAIYVNHPVTNSLIGQEFADPARFSHFLRDDGRIIRVERKPDYQYPLEIGHSYRLVPHPSSGFIFSGIRRLFDATLGKLIVLTAGDALLVVIFAIAQVLAITLQHHLLGQLHAAFPQPPKSPYFEYRQPRWKWECSQRVEFIVNFVAQQPTAFLAILLFARRRLRLEVTRAILLVGAHTLILHGIVIYLALDVLDHKVDMDWMRYILNWYTSIIYFSGVAALGLRH